MKYTKELLVVALIALLGTTVQAQENIVKFRPIGVWVQTLPSYSNGFDNYSRTFADYSIGFSYERVFTDKISGGLDFDIAFSGVALIILRPNVNFYLLDSAPHSLYVGGYFDTGFSSWGGGAHIGIGPKVGYQHLFLDDQLAVMGEYGLGFGMFTNGSKDGDGPGAGLNTYFTIGAGYAF